MYCLLLKFDVETLLAANVINSSSNMFYINIFQTLGSNTCDLWNHSGGSQPAFYKN